MKKMDKRMGRVRVAVACACALLLAACQNHRIEDEREAISFRSPTTKSRTVIGGDTDLQNACTPAHDGGGEAIGIMGTVFNDHNDYTLLFDNEALTYNTYWSYSPVRYWIRGALHNFLAIYPRQESGVYTFDRENGILLWNDITLSTENNIDVMYAAAERDLSLPEATTDPVQLKFQHAFALLEFRFVNASDSNVSSVTNISLYNLYHKGKFGFNKYGESGFELMGERAAVDTYVGRCDATNIPVDISKHYNLFANVGAVVVMPQAVYKQGVMLRLKVGSTTSDVNLGDFSTAYEWEAGKKYVYTLTRTSSDITFDVRVVDWVEDFIEL